LRADDVGYADDAGFLHLLGRTDGVINRGGEKVYPRVVEEVLRSHPGVADVAVVGVPDPVLGERPVAFVVPRGAPQGAGSKEGPGTPGNLPDQLSALCERELRRHQRPARILLTDSLPSTPTGKVRRDALRALAAS
jgi:acyl-CoA synthetase (AMP-forming)/AMP-acid ligase II